MIERHSQLTPVTCAYRQRKTNVNVCSKFTRALDVMWNQENQFTVVKSLIFILFGVPDCSLHPKNAISRSRVLSHKSTIIKGPIYRWALVITNAIMSAIVIKHNKYVFSLLRQHPPSRRSAGDHTHPRAPAAARLLQVQGWVLSERLTAFILLALIIWPLCVRYGTSLVSGD